MAANSASEGKRGVSAPPHARRGFALLEAIVALALISGAGLALFGWINQNLETAARLDDRMRTLQLKLNAQSYMESINPAAEPTGEFAGQGLRLRWDATLVEPMRTNLGFEANYAGSWRVGLYRIEIEAMDARLADPVRFVQLQPGWAPVARAEAGAR